MIRSLPPSRSTMRILSPRAATVCVHPPVYDDQGTIAVEPSVCVTFRTLQPRDTSGPRPHECAIALPRWNLFTWAANRIVAWHLVPQHFSLGRSTNANDWAVSVATVFNVLATLHVEPRLCARRMGACAHERCARAVTLQSSVRRRRFDASKRRRAVERDCAGRPKRRADASAMKSQS